MPHQQDLFSDAPEARECVECGEKFVPAEDYHEYWDECWERRQKRKPRQNESGAAWVERFYGARE